jgi:hypothetical protein
MVEFVAYTLIVLVMVGALRYMMEGVVFDPSTTDTTPVAPRADASSTAQ